MINLHLKVDKFIELKLPKKEDAIPVFLLIMKNRDWLGKYMEWESTTKTPQDIADFFEEPLRSSNFCQKSGRHYQPEPHRSGRNKA